MKKPKTKALVWWGVCTLLLVCALACALALRLISGSLLSQQEAERWRGESEQSFVQLSCFLPDDAVLPTSEIYTFRYAMLEALSSVGVEWPEERYPFTDAWSAEGKLHISGEKGATDAPVIAVGGDFFSFHPLRLLSGSYLTEEDFSQDRVLLDRALAWELFGGVDLAGMPVEINGRSFIVGGVVERENDAASRRAYTGEKGFFMSWDAYRGIIEKDAISCYELVLPEPVQNFGAQLVADKFPLKGGVSLVNTDRFSYDRLLTLARDLPVRAAHAGKVAYPYWENAARIAENECAVLALLSLVLALPCTVTLLAFLIALLVRGRNALEKELLPKAREGVEEAIRVRARRRWEKKHRA